MPESNNKRIITLICASLSISIVRGALLLWNIHLSVGPQSVLWQNGCLDLDVICGGEWGWSRDRCIRLGWLSLKGRGSFGSEVEASHCNQLGTLLHSCVEVSEPIELSFGVVSGVGPSIDVQMGLHIPQGEGAVSGIFRHLRPNLFEWAEWRIGRPEMYSTCVWKVDISTRTRYCWKRHFIGFLTI